MIFNKINIRTFDEKKFESEPLVLRNYSDINSDYIDEHIIEYHILQQIQYLLDLYYPKKEDRFLFRLVSVRNVMTNPEFKVFSIENKMTDYLPLQHNKYQLDFKKMKEIFDQVLSYIKSQIPIEVSKHKKKVTKKNEKTVKLLHKLKIKSKKENNNDFISGMVKKKVGSKKKMIYKLKSKSKFKPKLKSKSKPKHKSKSKPKKDLLDIKLPFDEQMVPGVEINIPKKVES
jgi:hypothetical protein